MKENKSDVHEENGMVDGDCEPPPPPFNPELDPDNITSPLGYEERVEQGRELFYPEGGPESPPTRSYSEAYE